VITIAFYSYKGGVGRSLALTNLGVYLAGFGATVVMVDFDLEAPGLHYKVRPGHRIKVDGRGLAGLLADVSDNREPQETVRELVIDVSEHVDVVQPEEQGSGVRGRLLLLPAGEPTRAQYWSDLARIDWDYLFTRDERPGVTAIESLRDDLATEFTPDVLLVDSRTGITPGGGVATTLLPDVVVAMMLNNAEHIDGTRIVISAVANAQGAAFSAPRVVPVLGRYTDSRLVANARVPLPARAFTERSAYGPDEEAESEILNMLRNTLVAGLDNEALHQVATPVLLHTDLELQQLERLTFGRYASSDASEAPQTLFEDYVRLFAALVPSDVFLRYVAQIRARARELLLDRPDDAVRSLESLAVLVEDEAVFVDLMKAYVLRRDLPGMVRAADRLYRVHRKIIVHDALTAALRDPTRRPAREWVESVDFAEAYWMAATPEDVGWGSVLARRLADGGKSDRAAKLALDILGRSRTSETLTEVVQTVAQGGGDAERLAVRLAIDHFDVGAESLSFLSAAARACGYHPDPELAQRILDSPNSRGLHEQQMISLLEAVERYSEASQVLLDVLAPLDATEDQLDEYVQAWQRLSRRTPALRRELEQTNPTLVHALDAYGPRGGEFDERLRPRRFR
jgi:hypothetical protein